MYIKLESLFPGAKHIHFVEINSTNLFAQDLLSKSLPAEGTLITADFQTQGRGQYGRTWQSESTNNLLASIILYPKFLSIIDQFAISRMVSKAVFETLAQWLPNKKIKFKWPNDIYFNDQKIAGILIQNFISGNSISSCIIGMGINVNQISFASDIKATSFRNFTDEVVPLEEVLSILTENLQKEYVLLKKDQDLHFDFYNEYLFRKNETSLFEMEGSIIEGKIIGTDRQGRLLLDQNGHINVYVFGTLKWLNK